MAVDLGYGYCVCSWVVVHKKNVDLDWAACMSYLGWYLLDKKLAEQSPYNHLMYCLVKNTRNCYCHAMKPVSIA